MESTLDSVSRQGSIARNHSPEQPIKSRGIAMRPRQEDNVGVEFLETHKSAYITPCGGHAEARALTAPPAPPPHHSGNSPSSPMPLIYTHRTRLVTPEITTPPRPSPVPVPTDVDDSIVLSDLVRQGEASRLRRRGAMRLDHGPVAVQPPIPPQASADVPPTIADTISVWEPEPAPEPEEGAVFSRNITSERGSRFTYGYGSGRARPRTDACDDGEEYRYTLFCGSQVSPDSYMDVDLDQNQWQATPYEPSILPLYPQTPSPVPSSSRRFCAQHATSTGCGALLHMHASPRRRLGVWQARNEAASGAVIGLDPTYFDRSAVAKIVRSACGCVREGVGCAVCGNPLGTRYKPCKTAAEGIFSSRPRPLSPLQPEGSRYWHAQSRTTRSQPSTSSPQPSTSSSDSQHVSGTQSSSSFYVYTFFGTSVTSSPSYEFLPRPPAALPPPTITVPQQPQTPPIRTPYVVQQLSYRSSSRTLLNTLQPIPPITESLSSLPFTAVSQPQPTPSSITPVASTSDDGNDEGDQAILTGVPANADPGRPDSPVFIPTLSPSDVTMVFDRGLTASPSPLSNPGDSSRVRDAQDTAQEESDAVYPYRFQFREPDAYTYRYQPMEDAEQQSEAFDPDGDFITEPQSPDKTGDLMLFPER